MGHKTAKDEVRNEKRGCVRLPRNALYIFVPERLGNEKHGCVCAFASDCSETPSTATPRGGKVV